jgi:hypothetical protein
VARSIVVGVVVVAATLVLLVVRDQKAQERIDRLSAQVARLESAVRASPPDGAPAAPPPEVRCGYDSTQIDAMARAVATALSSRAPGGAGSYGGAVPDAGSAPRSPEQEEAMDRARALVDAALRRKALTREDVLALRRELITADSPQEAEQLRLSLFQAINRGDLVPEDRILP